MTLGDQTLAEPDYEKGRALLAYLILQNQLHSREQLSELLWPGSPMGRANLRQVLSNLRQVLRDDATAQPCLLVKRDSLRLNPHSSLQIDAVAFAAARPAGITPGTPADSAGLAQLAQVVGRYRGEFMAGFSLPDCPAFNDWLQIQREALHHRALALLEQLASGHEQLGDFNTALQFALRHIELEPLDEAACRSVMRLYVSNGQPGAALAQFDTCSRLLKQELGVLPSLETGQLAQRVRKGQRQARQPRRRAPTRSLQMPASVERRQVTVLYCELSVSAVDDPEEAMALLLAPQSHCIDIIRHFSGHLVQTHGGGLLAYFGYPRAQEDAARRAVQAALTVTRTGGAGIRIRASVHTGMIITGADTLVPDTVGKTSQLAMQLRFAGAAGEVMISAETQRLVNGYFTCIPQVAQVLPGWPQPLNLFKVSGESGASTRLEAAAQLSPLAGRQAEMAQLMALWASAAQGQPAVLMIQGEAGIGKSRLLRSLRERLVGRPHAVRELRCLAEFSQSPFHPLIMMFEALLGFMASDTPDQKWGKLRRYIETHGATLAAPDLLLFAGLLGLPTPGPGDNPGFSAKKAKKRTLHLVLEMLQWLSHACPTLLIVEDVHWIDPSTLEFLSLYVDSARLGMVLALFTARPEFVAPWPPTRYTTLALGPLMQRDISTLLTALAAQLPPATRQSIAERADGVPLFAEEMASLAAQGDPTGIPATLQDLLAARMDRLGAAKSTAQLAATLGREFDLLVLQKLFVTNPGRLAQDLRALQDAGLLLTINDSTRQFKHALIQQAAYQCQSRAQRQDAHQRIAQVLLHDFPDSVTKQPERLAQHLANGGELATSIDYWSRAAQRAALNSANQEAIAHFNAALQLLPGLPADAQRDRCERNLLISLCPVLYAVEGYGCEQAARWSARIVELNAQLGDDPKSFQTQWAQMVSTMASSSSRGMPQAALRLLAMAQADPMKKMAAHTLAAIASFWLGNFAQARLHDELAIALYHPDQRKSLVRNFGSDLVVNCKAYLACTLYFLGYPAQAQSVCQQMLVQARSLDHPHTLAQALSFAALLQRWLRLPEAALPFSAEAIDISRQHDFHLWLACGEMTHGWARVTDGDEGGLAEIESGIATMRLGLGGISMVFFSSRIEAYVCLKRYAEALDLLAQALAEAQRTGDGHYLAELHRLKGACLLALSPDSATEVELCFGQALTISRNQKGRSLALRAATSLAGLWQQQGKPEAGRALLKEMLGAFSEGFDTYDLRNAAQLLRTLV